MKKIIINRIKDGILYGSAMFAFSLLLIDYVFDGSLTVLPHQYSRIILGAFFIGIGFNLSSLIYEEDQLRFLSRIVIQLLLCTATIFFAFVISGGIPDGTGYGTRTVFVLVEVLVGFIFWVGNVVYFFHEARMIKKKLGECDV